MNLNAMVKNFTYFFKSVSSLIIHPLRLKRPLPRSLPAANLRTFQKL